MTDSPHTGRDSDKDSQRLPFLAAFLATGLYSGYIPWASGTFGSIVGVLLYLIPGAETDATLSVMVVAGFFVGVFTSAKVAAIHGHRLTKTAELAKAAFQPGEHEVPDPSIIVIDEIVGMWISLMFLPKTLPVILIAFVAFRIFDIVKPYPARQLEKIPHGWGIMLDDVIAGVYANVATMIAYDLLQRAFPAL